MNGIRILLYSCCFIFLSSCKFSCSVGSKDDEPSASTYRNGIRISNDIEVLTEGVQVDKAYLLFNDRTAVPEGNVVDFTQPVKLILIIEKGWKEENGRVKIGAYEKIEVETGEVLVEEQDMFAAYEKNGIDANDAKYIVLTATVNLKKKITPLTTFIVSFRVWDKSGTGYIQGRYKLYSK